MRMQVWTLGTRATGKLPVPYACTLLRDPENLTQLRIRKRQEHKARGSLSSRLAQLRATRSVAFSSRAPRTRVCAHREAHNSLLWPSLRLESLRTSGSQRGSQEKARSICSRHRGPELSSPGADEGSLQVPGAGPSASSSQTRQRDRGRRMWR